MGKCQGVRQQMRGQKSRSIKGAVNIWREILEPGERELS